MKKVFVSYSRRNLTVVERLARDLQDAGLDVWVDFRKIKGGEAWRQAIYNGITESEFTIICLSPPAVESEWVRRELQIAHQHKKLIIPLMLERAFDEMQQYDETKVLLDVQIINFADLSYERAFPTLLSSLPGVYTPGQDYDDIDPSDIPNPFKGLEAFQEFDSEIFFGREDLIERAIKRLEASIDDDTDTARFLGVVGASGSGKSSLVRAGLIPAIRKGKITNSEDFPIAIVKPGSDPIKALAQRLLPLIPDTDDWESLFQRLTASRESLSEIANDLLANSYDNAQLVLVIDQFEEVFTRSPYRAQVEFIEMIQHAVTEVGGRVLVIITMRADFFDRVSHFANLARLIEDDKLLIVSEMSPEELRRSIEGPAIAVGLVYDHGLPDRILEEVLQQPGSLPLLQYALTELYDRRDRRRLTWDAYNDIGGVRQALAQHAEEIFTGLNSAQQDIMQRLLLRLVEVSETGEATRRRVRRNDLSFERVSDNALNDILDLMTSAEVRLLVASRDVRPDSEDDEPTIWIEVVHEALIREWERFQGWVKEDEENLRLSTEILKSAQDWVNADREDAYLLMRTRLDRALVWVQTADASTLQRDFINASATARRKREAAEREQQQYVSQLEERSARRLRIIAASLAVGFVVVLIAAVFAFNAQREAERQEEQTRSRALAQEVERILAAENPDTPLALALAIEANSIDNPPALAQSALANAGYFGPVWMTTDIADTFSDAQIKQIRMVDDSRYAVFLTTNNQLNVVYINVDTSTIEPIWDAATESGSRLLTIAVSETLVAGGTESGKVYLWERESGELLQSITLANPIWSLAIAPDDEVIAVGSESGDVTLHSTISAADLTRLNAHSGRVLTLAFNDAGDQLISGGTDTLARLWDANSYTPLTTLNGHISWVRSAAFNPIDAQVVTGASDGTLIIWNTETGTIEHLLTNAHNGSIQAVDFNPNGSSFVSVASDTEVSLWDSSLGERRHIYSDHRATVTNVVYSADGERLLSADAGLQLMAWEVDPGPVQRRYEVHRDWVQAVAYSPDSQYAVSGGLDGRLLLWDLTASDNEPIDTLYSGETGILSLAYAPDGTAAMVGLTDGQLLLWDVDGETWRLRETIAGHDDSVRSIVFSPDSQTVLTTSDDTSMILWDADSGRQIRRYERHEAQVWSAAFTPDGQYILSGDEAGVLRWWNTERGASIEIEADEDNQLFHEDSIRAVAISPDGQFAVTASDDLRLIRWEITDAPNIRPIARNTLEGHQERVTSLSFSADGQYLLSGSDDQTVIMWETQDWLAIRRLLGHGNVINAVRFAPNGRTALSGAADQAVILWRIDTPAELLNWAITNRAVAELTCEDRAIYQVAQSCNNNVAPNSTPLVTRAVEIAQVVTIEAPLVSGTATPTLTALPPTATEIPPTPVPDTVELAASEGDNRGTLNAGERHSWQFSATAGQMVTISVFADTPARSATDTNRNPNGLDPILTIYDPLGKVVVSVDDIRDGYITDAQIARLTLARDGVYRAEVSAWDGQSNGDYTLQIVTVNEDEAASATTSDN